MKKTAFLPSQNALNAFALHWLRLFATVVLGAPFSSQAQQTFNTFQAASVVVGQPNFTSELNTSSQTVTAGPSSVAVSATGKMAIGGENGNRVLIWNSIPTTNGAPADVVVGQPDFTSTTPGTTASQLRSTEGVAFSPDGSKLLVCDTDNNRVLIWNTVPTTNGQPADVVVGQTNFTSSGSGTSSSKLDSPTGVLVTPDGKMLITDSANNRVLVFNSIPTTNGASAVSVIGQLDLISKVAGKGSKDLTTPWQTAYSGDGKILVADSANNRVLVYGSLARAQSIGADVIIGQKNFGQDSPGTSQKGLFFPRGVAVSASGQLAIGELKNNRVVIHNSIPTSNEAPADVVLGQPDFDSNLAFFGGVSAQSMATVFQLAYAPNGRLLVSGNDMHRVMIFGDAGSVLGPVVVTDAATNVVPTSAQLNGYVYPNGNNTDVHFEYSTDSALAGALSTPVQTVAAGTEVALFSAPLTGLLPKAIYYFRAVATNAGGTANGAILSFNSHVLNWGRAGASPTTGVLDPTLIPTSNTHTFANVNGQGYDIVVTTHNLNKDGAASYFGDAGWWFEGGGPDFGYGTVTFRFYETGTTIPYPLFGIDFRLLDAEINERFRSFAYFDELNNFFNVPYGTGRLTFSHNPIFHASDNSYDNNAPREGGDQVGKWIELNLADLAITGFTFEAHRQTAGAGSVIMSDLITPFALWRATYFGPIPYPPAADDFANPDGDAPVNILEYFYGTNPTRVDTPDPLQMSVVANKVTLTFPRDTSATDATATVQGADSASGPWTDLARSVNAGLFAPLIVGVDVSESPSGQVRSVEVRDLYLVGDPMHPMRFLRLQVVH